MKVLVVDDCEDSVRALGILFTMSGYETREALSAPAALIVAQEWTPDIVVLDVRLGAMDGYDLADQLRNVVHLSSATIIALSGSKDDIERRDRCGIDGYMMKPAYFDELRALVDRHRSQAVPAVS